jgi:hypothetical protein
MKFSEYIKEEEEWRDQIYELILEKYQTLPRGWTKDSVKKFAQTLANKAATEKGFFDLCVEKMKKHFDNPEGFCAYVKDTAWGTTYWRKGKGPEKTKKEIESSKKNVKVRKSLPKK